MCRQFIREFSGLEMPVYMFDGKGDHIVMTVNQVSVGCSGISAGCSLTEIVAAQQLRAGPAARSGSECAGAEAVNGELILGVGWGACTFVSLRGNVHQQESRSRVVHAVLCILLISFLLYSVVNITL